MIPLKLCHFTNSIFFCYTCCYCCYLCYSYFPNYTHTKKLNYFKIDQSVFLLLLLICYLCCYLLCFTFYPCYFPNPNSLHNKMGRNPLAKK